MASTVTLQAAPWNSNATQPTGGGAQARLAEHLSAGAPTSAGDHDTSASNKTSERSPPLYAMLIPTEIKYC